MIHYSGILMEKLLTLDVLKDARILAGTAGMSKRVTKVNVMEVPDILDWVSDGELLLTTAFPIKDNIQTLHDLIPMLKSKGVAGLGIKLGRYVPELPENVISLADELGFPIIEIPLTVPHTDVISAILTEVINDHMNMFIKMEEFNLEVMNIMIKGGGMKEIAGKLYDSISNTLAIYEKINDSYELICPDDMDRNEIDRIIRDYTRYRHPGDYERPEEPNSQWMDNIGGKSVLRVTIPIIIEKIQYGYIFIWLDSRPLTPLDNMLIESYVHIIALEFVKRLALYNMESNYKLDFFDDLLSDNLSRQKKALEKAKAFDFKKELKYSVIIVLLKELSSINKFTYKKANFAKESMSSVVSVIKRLSRLHDENVIYVEKNDRIIILHGDNADMDNHEIKRKTIAFCEKLLAELKDSPIAGQLCIGLGRSFYGVEQLWKSYEQAKLIVENISRADNSNILHYDDLGLYRFLSFDGLQNELLEFYSATIKPLVEYDKANNSELVKTLKCYYGHNTNMKKMAETMHMHYNTIIYRLQKIKDIIGVDINDPENRLNFEIAIKIMDLIQVK